MKDGPLQTHSPIQSAGRKAAILLIRNRLSFCFKIDSSYLSEPSLSTAVCEMFIQPEVSVLTGEGFAGPLPPATMSFK